MEPLKLLLWALALAASASGDDGEQEATPSSSSSASACPLTAPSCTCEAQGSAHELWCPDSFDDTFRVRYKTGQMGILCNTERVHTEADFVFAARNISVGDSSVESLQIVGCPVLSRSYAALTEAMGITGLKELVVNYGATPLDEEGNYEKMGPR